jgi:fatty-acyl-CoA synthase
MITVLDKIVREIKTLRILAATGLAVRRFRPDGSLTLADVFEGVVDRNPASDAVVFEGRVTSYADLEAAANRVANWARSTGIGRGDVVALLMNNRTEYLSTWLGLIKIGAQVALVNTNLTSGPLSHALGVSGAVHIIVGAELAGSLATVRAELGPDVVVWAAGGPVEQARDLDAALALVSPERSPASLRAGMRTADNLFFIYTSGTTGNPKAAFFSHLKFLSAVAAYTAFCGITRRDRIYCVLPLYHTAGGVLAVGMALTNGAALILRDRFSTRRFWDDCRSNRVTVFQYIGELCRYLLGVPGSADDRQHDVRCAVGNGLRPDIWEEFQHRFGISEIREFYGATEANFGLVNVDNKVGAVGRIPPYARAALPVDLVRFDVETETHPRDTSGHCIRCEPGEPGEVIGRIPADKASPVGRFEGYRDEAASDKKVLRDVFVDGDRWYRSGDLLSRDDEGYYYFVDRIGDTFRWKGENVATSQVSEVVSTFGGVKEANVYGVSVPGADGRAGMAAVVVDGQPDMAAFYHHVTEQLPAYARPLFLRLRPRMETTGTFKHRKIDLVEDGFDPARVDEPLFVLDDATSTYRPLDAAAYARILEGKARL